MAISSTFGIIVILFCVQGRVIELPLVNQYGNLPDIRTYTAFLMDGQHQSPMLDTASPFTILVLKEWYESVHGAGSCNQLISGCYSCPEPCPRTKKKMITFGAAKVSIFQHTATFSSGSASAKNIVIGLIDGWTPIPPFTTRPRSVLGLSAKMSSDYPPLLDQLKANRIVDANTFAMFLRPTGSASTVGSLFLGGGNPAAYHHPLRYAPVVSQLKWYVKLNTLQVGQGVAAIGIDNPVNVDFGSNILEVPVGYYIPLIKKIGTEASRIAKKTISPTWIKKQNVWTIQCSDQKYMPRVTLGFASPQGDVLVGIDGPSYVKVGKSICLLRFRQSTSERWMLPDFAMIGNYFEFQGGQKRIGVASI